MKVILRTALPVLALFLAGCMTGEGLFSQARTEGKRLDDAKPLVVKDIQVYSFLQDGSGVDGRLSKDAGRYLQVVADALRAKGVQVQLQDLSSGTLRLHTTPLGVGGVAGFESTLTEESRAEASDIVREHRSGDATVLAGYRLLLLPENVVRSTGVQWGSRVISTGGGTWFSRGAQPSGVPHYSFRVYWLLEDADNQPVAAGTTSAILDIRGFPHKAMSEQMLAELERLGIQWPGALDSKRDVQL